MCASAKSSKCKCKSPSDDSGERLKAVTLRGGNTLQSIRLRYTGWSGKACAHAPTYFCSIVCKCHFPLRWCKALLHGTFPPPPALSCTARSNIILNLLSSRTQQFGEMGARRSSASAILSAGILWAGILRALDCLQRCWSNRAMACTLSVFQPCTDEMVNQTRNGEYFLKLYDDFSWNFFFSSIGAKLSWGLRYGDDPQQWICAERPCH